jgi:hypothetical protein
VIKCFDSIQPTGRVTLELQQDLIESVIALAEKNSLDPSDFLSIILSHTFHDGVDIRYILDDRIQTLDVNASSVEEAAPSPQGMVQPLGH